MGGADAPEPTDPRETSSASTGTNIGTAVANAFLNNYNQKTPNGNLTFNKTGSYKWTDSYTGKTYKIPTLTATQTLSKTGKKLQGLNDKTQINLGGLAANQSKFLKEYTSTPFDGEAASKATADSLYNLGRTRLDPKFAQEREGLETRLSGQGIKLGSEAYDRAMANFGNQENDAYNTLALNGQGQAFQQALTSRNQPINEITALLSGSQVAGPSYVNPNTSPIPTTDVAGIIGNYDQQKLSAWQQEQQNSNGLLGGLFSLGSAGIMKFSDRRLKTDIRRVGHADNGLPLYSYMIGGSFEIGLMADEVEAVRPDAVIETSSGFKAVDYGKALG